MRIIEKEESQKSFPFEPFSIHKISFNGDEKRYDDEKMKVLNELTTRDRAKIKRYLDCIYEDMEKNESNISIYRKLCDNIDKLIFTFDGSYLLNPLVYDENLGSFWFQTSIHDFEAYVFNSKMLTTEQFLDRMLDVFGGLVFRIFRIETPNYILNSNESFTGKAIKRWCEDNNESEISKKIIENYFSNGKYLGKFIYYNIVEKKDGSVKVYRDLERSPRKK